MDKTLIFISDKNSYFFPYIQNDTIRVENIWSKKCKNKNSLFIRICRKLRLPIGIFFGDWKKDIRQYNKIIIFDGCYDKLLTYYLNNRVPKSLKYIFCWNGKQRIGHVLEAEYPIYSYSPNDCAELRLKYQPTVYCKDVVFESEVLVYDVLFVGRIKGRQELLDKIYCKFTENNIKAMFYILGKENEIGIPVHDKPLEYNAYLNFIVKSRVLLDVSSYGQDGLSMRVMEALFFKKKLITTNTDIVRYDFYRPENILILDENNWNVSKDFLYSEYVEVPEEIVEKYDITNWLTLFK